MRHRFIASASLAAIVLAVSANQTRSAPAQGGIPQLTSSPEMSWQVNFWDFTLAPPPGSGHGPILTDPAFPYTSQIQNGGQVRARKGTIQIPIVDTKDPILKPWAAKEIQETNDAFLNDRRALELVTKLDFRNQSRCWPGGVPGQLLFLEPVYFLQTPKEVVMLWQRNSLARHIYLDTKHSEHVKPSWSGESIGHYENGDTLVVDTIGIAGGKYHYIDSFRTPHTDKLHVVERYTVAPDGKTLTAIVTVDDPDTFNGPLTLTQVWRRTNFEIQESVCAEDGGLDVFHQDLEPIPVAAKPDF